MSYSPSMTSSKRWLSPLAVALLIAAESVCAGDLERLFYSPRERAALDAQRNKSAAPGLEGDTLTVNGVVTRSSGRSTVWINGAPQQEGQEGAVEVLRKQAAGGKVTLRPPAKDKAVDLKVGQTLEGSSGRVREVYEPAPTDRNAAESGQ